LALAVAGGLAIAASGCGQGSASGPQETPEPSRGAASSTCDPAFSTGVDPADVNYYRVNFQMASCLPYELPMSVDISAPYANTPSNPLAQAASVTADAGPGVSAGSVPNSIPEGGSDSSGAIVGFGTAPGWDGFMPPQQGPCANSVVASDGSGVVNPNAECEVQPASMKPDAKPVSKIDFSGRWTLYLPTGTIDAYVVTPSNYKSGRFAVAGYPYVSEYYQSSNPDAAPGALATGVALVRQNLVGEPQPLFISATKGTPTASKTYKQGPPSSSPPAGDFVPTAGCLDSISVKNGANTSQSTASAWSSKISDQGRSWQLSTIYGEGQGQANPFLYFLKGWAPTQNGSLSTIALNSNINKVLSRKAHTFQFYLQDLTGIKCSGSDKAVPFQMLGGSGSAVELTGAGLSSPLVGNSTFRFIDLRQVNTAGSKGVMAYTALLPGKTTSGQSSASKLTSANLAGMNMTGSIFPNVDFGAANLKGANLAYADLSTSRTAQVNDVNAIYCQTRMPDGSINTDDCNRLTGLSPWSGVSADGCNPARCSYVSVYNNTTRVLTKGQVECLKGDQIGDVSTPSYLAPLETAQLSFGPGYGTDRSITDVRCSFTYANGPWGKVQVALDNSSAQGFEATASGGYCQGRDSAECLPLAAPKTLDPFDPDAEESDDDDATNGLYPPARDDNSPVKVSTTKATKGNATYYTVVMCEPEAYDEATSQCNTQPALPAWSDSDSQSDQPSEGVAVAAVGAPLAAAGYSTQEIFTRYQGVSPEIAGADTLAGSALVRRGGGESAEVYVAKAVDRKATIKQLRRLSEYAGRKRLADEAGLIRVSIRPPDSDRIVAVLRGRTLYVVSSVDDATARHVAGVVAKS